MRLEQGNTRAFQLLKVSDTTRKVGGLMSGAAPKTVVL